MSTFEIVISCAVGVIFLTLGAAVSFAAGFMAGRHWVIRSASRPMQQFVMNESAERKIEELLTNAQQQLQDMAAGGEPPKPEYVGTSPAR